LSRPFLFFFYGIAPNFCLHFTSEYYNLFTFEHTQVSEGKDYEMVDQVTVLPGVIFNSAPAERAASQLRQEYLEVQRLFNIQPAYIQRHLEMQAALMSDAILKKLARLHFILPERIVLAGEAVENAVIVPVEQREQMASGLLQRLSHTDLCALLRQRFLELEQTPNHAVATSAQLLQHAIAVHMVHDMLPAGRSVTYTTGEGDTIPSVPAESSQQPKSALASAADAITHSSLDQNERGELPVPYVEAARRFFLPQWVAFDNQGRMLAGSVNEAEAYIASMQNYLFVLRTAVSLLPYMVADEQYQQKRYGILGQLVNQGRALARYQIGEVIQTIRRRAAAHDLDRGLSLILPYFNDESFTIENYEFNVIPAGRIMFVPAFVVRACHDQQLKVAQDTQLSPSTRRHLLIELYLLGKAFYPQVGL
jgi:hypothetical protein